MSRTDLHSAWARLFLASLRAAGVDRLVLSPGSRSTPLALAAAATEGLELTVALDERVAGFLALGHARTTGRPAGLLCTSGTAGAHYLPAVVEASHAEVPLVAITADRPWELWGCGASQTIEQRGLFGPFVRFSAHLGEPSPGLAALRAVPRLAAQLVARALGPSPGPVHVDAAFRKPLEPVLVGREPFSDEIDRLLSVGPPRVGEAPRRASDAEVSALVGALRGAGAPLLVAGPARAVDAVRLPPAVRAFADAAEAPIVAEVASGLRLGPEADRCLGNPDELLGAEAFTLGARPDLLIEVGLPPVSSAWLRLAERGETPRVVVGAPGIADPAGTARFVAQGDAPDLLTRAAEELRRAPGDLAATRASSLARARRLGAAADAARTRAAAALPFGEAAVVRGVVEAVPPEAVLLLGNSGLLREIDAWAPARASRIAVQHQRGAAGIDGLIAGALGARLATPAARPVVALLGDVAAVHDLGALVAARAAQAPLVLVVVHNDGGRIFEQLPVAGSAARELERLFVVPHGVSIAAVARALELRARSVSSTTELRAALGDALVAPGTTIVEARVPPRDAGPRRRALGQAIDRALAEALA